MSSSRSFRAVAVALSTAVLCAAVYSATATAAPPAAAPAKAAGKGEPAKAASVYKVKCVACHKADGSGGFKVSGNPTPNWLLKKTWDATRTEAFMRDCIVNGKLKMLPGGKLGARHASFEFTPRDFRFTLGKNGELYAFGLAVPAPGTVLKIKSLGSDAKYRGQPVRSVTLLGHPGGLRWKQEADALTITTPAEMPFATAIAFRIE